MLRVRVESHRLHLSRHHVAFPPLEATFPPNGALPATCLIPTSLVRRAAKRRHKSMRAQRVCLCLTLERLLFLVRIQSFIEAWELMGQS